MDRIENHYRHEQLAEMPLRVHRKRTPYKARWCDGPFAILVGLLTVLLGLAFGTTAMGYFVCGLTAFLVGLLVNEAVANFNGWLSTPPLFTFANRLYVALNRWSRTKTAIIATKYKVGQRVEDHHGCISSIREIAAYRGMIFYRLNGFDYDYRESQLKAL